MLGEAALKGFIPAAVMPERPSFFRRRYIPIKNGSAAGRARCGTVFCIFNGTLGKERERKAFPESQGSVFSGRCVPTES